MRQIRLTAFIMLLASFCSKAYSQVSLQTGAAEFSLPLFSYDGNDKLHTAISLNYLDGNGLKVDEVSSVVGTGWGLQCGGVISREQRGLPDDQRRSAALPNPLPEGLQMSDDEYLSTYFPNGYLFSAYNPTDVITNEGGCVRTAINLPYSQARIAPEKEMFAADREQDIFRLNYGKGTVEFVIEKNSTITILNGSKVKIEYTLEDMLASKIKTCISQFTVTDVDGIKYIFSARELAQTCTYEKKRVADAQEYTSLEENYDQFGAYNWSSLMTIYPNQDPAHPNNLPRSYVSIGTRTGTFIVTKWYLSRITNPLTGKEVIFSYDTYDCEMQTQRLMTHSKTSSVTILKQILKPLRLTRIDMPNSRKVDFTYDNVPQVDVPNQRPLKEITVSDNNAIINRYAFEYQYFLAYSVKPYDYQFAESEKFLARLSLKSVQKKGISPPKHLTSLITI